MVKRTSGLLACTGWSMLFCRSSFAKSTLLKVIKEGDSCVSRSFQSRKLKNRSGNEVLSQKQRSPELFMSSSSILFILLQGEFKPNCSTDKGRPKQFADIITWMNGFIITMNHVLNDTNNCSLPATLLLST